MKPPRNGQSSSIHIFKSTAQLFLFTQSDTRTLSESQIILLTQKKSLIVFVLLMPQTMILKRAICAKLFVAVYLFLLSQCSRPTKQNFDVNIIIVFSLSFGSFVYHYAATVLS
jgi:hypothetical protein